MSTLFYDFAKYGRHKTENRKSIFAALVDFFIILRYYIR